MWTLGPSRIIIRTVLEGVLVSQELGLLEMGQGGKERWRELGVSDCKRETAEPDGLKITTGGFQMEKGKLLCLGMLKIHEVVQKGAVAKT